MIRATATVNGEVVISSIDWYVPEYTPSVEQQAVISGHMLGKAPMVVHHVDTTGFVKEVDVQNLSTFEKQSQEGANVLIRIIVGFQPKKKQIDSLNSRQRHPLQTTCFKRLMRNWNAEYS